MDGCIYEFMYLCIQVFATHLEDEVGEGPNGRLKEDHHLYLYLYLSIYLSIDIDIDLYYICKYI